MIKIKPDEYSVYFQVGSFNLDFRALQNILQYFPSVLQDKRPEMGFILQQYFLHRSFRPLVWAAQW